MKEQSDLYRDLTNPGWRERDAEHTRKFLDAIPERKRCKACRQTGMVHCSDPENCGSLE
jgi:hypothetical protein